MSTNAVPATQCRSDFSRDTQPEDRVATEVAPKAGADTCGYSSSASTIHERRLRDILSVFPVPPWQICSGALEARAEARGLRTVAGLGRRFAWSDYLASEWIAL